MERVQAAVCQTIVQFLNARLMRDRRVGKGSACRWFGGILTTHAVHMEQMLRLAVIGFEDGILQRPRRRNAVLVPDLVEVALPHAKECSAVDLRIAANVVMQAWMEAFAILAVPGLVRLIGAINEDGLRIPVCGRAWEIVTALEKQNALAARCEAMRHGRAAGPAADNNHIVMVRHASELSQPPVAKPG